MAVTPAAHTIPAHRPFADVLARTLWARAAHDPMRLAAMTIFVPTRRAELALKAAFLRLVEEREGALLMPALRPLGAVDAGPLEDPDGLDGLANAAADTPPAIDPTRRILLLARLVMARRDQTVSADQAVRLAGALARLLDDMQRHRVGWDALDRLEMPETLAEHWQKTASFLEILRARWPEILEAEGCLDPVDRHNKVVDAIIRRWRNRPPEGLVVAAGSTGSLPATAELLHAISELPNGYVILPGLDRTLDEADWATVARDPAHPQHTMARLLRRMGLRRADVRDWPPDEDGSAALVSARARTLANALRPAETSHRWHVDDGGTDAADPPEKLEGVARVDCATQREEALTIALAMRQSLEAPGRTAMLVTADRGLARQVGAALSRWDIQVDDSAGAPLADTPCAVFLRLVAVCAAQRLAPVALLAMLKHPLAAAGLPPAVCRRMARALERAALRGPRPAEGVAGLRAAVAAGKASPARMAGMDDFLNRLDSVFGPLTNALAARAAAPKDLLTAHVTAAEALAASDTAAGATRLWAGDAGEQLSTWLDAAVTGLETMPPMPPEHFPALLDSLLATTGGVTRPTHSRHPRLRILGPLEARLQHADLVILGGLNESSWPPAPEEDPWLSRPMRRALGLPPPEQRIGLSAHDFAQALCAADSVLITRAEKVNGQPTVPSRWLARLEAVAGHMDAAAPWRAWARMLDQAPAEPTPPPAPRPPAAARPRRLSATQVETWMRNPYAIFARHILRLRPLEPLEDDPGAAHRGLFIHAALERFVGDGDALPPEEALEKLLAIGRARMAEFLDQPAAQAFWWPRFVRVAEWFVAREADRAATIAQSHTETQGQLVIPAPGGDFILTARADRIDIMKDGTAEIIDYKTGQPPSSARVAAGLAPQLPLEAALLNAGGFPDLPSVTAERIMLRYWRLSGGLPAGEVSAAAGRRTAAELADEALKGLEALVAAFDSPDMPYHASPRAEGPPRHDDYAHLAREGEWRARTPDAA